MGCIEGECVFAVYLPVALGRTCKLIPPLSNNGRGRGKEGTPPLVLSVGHAILKSCTFNR